MIKIGNFTYKSLKIWLNDILNKMENGTMLPGLSI